MLESLLTQFRNLIDDIAPGPEILAQREALALDSACCALLMEVARLDVATGAAIALARKRVLNKLGHRGSRGIPAGAALCFYAATAWQLAAPATSLREAAVRQAG